MNVEVILLSVVALVIGIALTWVVQRWALKTWRFPLTRVTHLIPDEQGGWLHVLGVRSHMPEDGDPVSVRVHLMVEPRTGRWLSGDSEPGDDVTVNSPFVTRSLTALAAPLGLAPRLAAGGALPRRRHHERLPPPISLSIERIPSTHCRVREHASHASTTSGLASEQVLVWASL